MGRAMLLGLCLAFAGAAGADERRMLAADEAAAFRAVGRLNVAGTRFCTATLISDRLVLTAAHCLHHPRTRRRVPLDLFRFVPGLRRERNDGVRRVVRAVTAPGFVMGAGVQPQDLRADIALLELDAPVSAVASFAVGPPPADATPRTIVSYARDRSQAPSIQENCPTLVVLAEVAVLGCAVELGVSGAPVFAGEGDARRLVAVVSAMGRLPEGRAFTLSVLADPWLATLREALAAADAAPTP